MGDPRCASCKDGNLLTVRWESAYSEAVDRKVTQTNEAQFARLYAGRKSAASSIQSSSVTSVGQDNKALGMSHKITDHWTFRLDEDY